RSEHEQVRRSDGTVRSDPKPERPSGRRRAPHVDSGGGAIERRRDRSAAKESGPPETATDSDRPRRRAAKECSGARRVRCVQREQEEGLRGVVDRSEESRNPQPAPRDGGRLDRPRKGEELEIRAKIGLGG